MKDIRWSCWSTNLVRVEICYSLTRCVGFFCEIYYFRIFEVFFHIWVFSFLICNWGEDDCNLSEILVDSSLLPADVRTPNHVKFVSLVCIALFSSLALFVDSRHSYSCIFAHNNI